VTTDMDDEEPLPYEPEELAILREPAALTSPEVPDEEKSELDQLIAQVDERDAAYGRF